MLTTLLLDLQALTDMPPQCLNVDQHFYFQSLVESFFNIKNSNSNSFAYEHSNYGQVILGMESFTNYYLPTRNQLQEAMKWVLARYLN